VFKAVSVTSISARTMAATPIADLLLLPRGERLALAMALWDSLDDEGRNEVLPVDATLGTELDRRWEAHLENPAAAVPWDQVRSQLALG
jgi:putative addiction module component (TIGR02574 family)